MNINRNYMKISNFLFFSFFTLAFLSAMLGFEAEGFKNAGLSFLILLPSLRLIFFFSSYRRDSEKLMMGVCALLAIILITGFFLR